jgi:stress response protein SCP2
MVLGKLVRTGSNWEFIAIGEATPTKNIDETILYIQANYLN